jgi:hypothetical protein
MATYKHLRSSTANKRPTTSIADGQLAINTNTASPGLFFKDSAGTGIVKVGPVHVGTTAPNSVPASGGSTGNYLGEQWLDTSVSPAQMKVWNGSTWVGIVADELPVSKLQDGSARQLIQTDAAGTGVEWTSSIDLPGTLDVTGASTLDSTLSVAGVSSFASGSAAAPSLTFTGDTNTGIYRPGADQVAISTNGTGRLFVDASGNVGVGAASAGNLLHLSTAGTSYLQIQNTTAGNSVYLGNSSGNGILQVDGANSLNVSINGSERARIDSSGRLLVGTSSARTNLFNSTVAPAIQLEGAGIVPAQRFLSVINNYATAGDGGGVIALGRSKGGTVGSNTVVASNDQLGRFDFQGNDGTEFVTGAAIESYVDGTPGANDMPGRLVFSTTADGASSPTERMRITNQGAIWAAVGTSIAQFGSTIHYNGWRQASGDQWVGSFQNVGSSGGYGVIIQNLNTTQDTSYWFLNCNNNNGNKVIFYTNGGIANYQSNDANLCDEREKKNIETLDSTWNCLKEWELKKFHYNEDSDVADKRYGVIAQQIAEHCPEVITDWTKQKAEDAVLDEDGNVVTPAVEEVIRMGVKEQQMMWMAIKALQEAQLRIETLEAEVVALKGA